MLSLLPQKDAKAVFDDVSTVNAVANRVADLVEAAGLSSAFLNPEGSGVSAITLTGKAP